MMTKKGYVAKIECTPAAEKILATLWHHHHHHFYASAAKNRRQRHYAFRPSSCPSVCCPSVNI